MSLCPQITHYLIWLSAAQSQWLTAWVIAQPWVKHNSVRFLLECNDLYVEKPKCLSLVQFIAASILMSRMNKWLKGNVRKEKQCCSSRESLWELTHWTSFHGLSIHMI
jgi:hypothetical protein